MTTNTFPYAIVGLLSLALFGQAPPYAPLGDGSVNRYAYTVRHSKKSRVVLLDGELLHEKDETKAVLTWILAGPRGGSLDEEPIDISYDQASIYFETSTVPIRPSDANPYDSARRTSGLLSHGDSYKVKGKEWGPWRSYLFVDDSGVTVLTISATHGIMEWTEYMDLDSYIHQDFTRKFKVIGTTKHKMETPTVVHSMVSGLI